MKYQGMKNLVNEYLNTIIWKHHFLHREVFLDGKCLDDLGRLLFFDMQPSEQVVKNPGNFGQSLN